ncbi:N-methylhydantoinase B [Constrictibacter sp. MBR-5]|jgi:N-methylhydantoinase B|uniref:hydantoinase B/oxoprolinase family protein n=1 Tax=Constrictibacter sp. MBR-5 TaxID=3156467 RepID=UPI003392190C
MDRRSDRTPFDPATLEVVWTRLISAVDEAAAALVRTAFSTVVRESYDFSCVITDVEGRSIAQATESIPVFIGTLPRTVRHMLQAFPPETLSPGDVLITNDAWMGTGHLPDVNVAKPIFVGGRLVAFAASTAHAPDIGGRSGQNYIRDIFEEGLQIPIMKLIDRGEVDETIVAVMRANVRAADDVLGDLWAQVTALDVVERRLTVLMQEYELTDLGPLAEEIQGRSEAAMRRAIAALPNGTYRHSLTTDGALEPVRIETAVTITDDEMIIDFEGSSAQIDGAAINVPFCYSYAFTVYAAKCILSPDIPNNEGAFLPIVVKAPAGSIVNSQFPTSGGSRNQVGHFLPVGVFGALAQVVPDRVMGASGSPLWSIKQSGVTEDGRPYANLFFFNGGMGASHRRDGENCLSWPSNVSNSPVEMIERQAPMRVTRKRLREGSGGAGTHRGGLGQEIVFEILSPTPIVVTFGADRTRVAAEGVAGGAPGALGATLINGKAVDAKETYTVHRGDTVSLLTPGAGGFGPPERRAPDAVLADRLEGYAGAGE